MADAPAASSYRLHLDRMHHLRPLSSLHRNLIAMLWNFNVASMLATAMGTGEAACKISVENLAGQWVYEL